jgi:hypothetical protein
MKKAGLLTWLTVLAMLIFAGVAAVILENSGDQSTLENVEVPKPTVKRNSSRQGDAVGYCYMAVKMQLGLDDCDNSLRDVQSYGDSLFDVRGSVRYTNGYGHKIKRDWAASLMYTGNPERPFEFVGGDGVYIADPRVL